LADARLSEARRPVKAGQPERAPMKRDAVQGRPPLTPRLPQEPERERSDDDPFDRRSR
jgi:hypothetical protein